VGVEPARTPRPLAEPAPGPKALGTGIEFKTFVNAFVRLPCQILRTGRRLVYRLLAWNPHQPIFFRLMSALRC